jgi:hypothetical protein
MQIVPITTNVVSSNPTQGDEYWIQYYVIKLVSDLRHVGGFLWVLRSSCVNIHTTTTLVQVLFCYFIRRIQIKNNPYLFHYYPLEGHVGCIVFTNVAD